MQKVSLANDPALEEILQDATLTQHREAILWAANATDEELLPEKILVVRKEMIRQKIKSLAVEHSDWTLREAVVQILKDMPDSIPPGKLLELTRFTIEQWELFALNEADVPT